MNRQQAKRALAFDAAVTVAIGDMARGASLHAENVRGVRTWWLSNGRKIPGRIAEQVIQHKDVIDVGDALFGGITSQTYRHSRKA
jgi:hypothetical protein